MKYLVLGVLVLLLVSCDSRVEKYCDIQVENLSSSPINGIEFSSKIGDGTSVSASFGSVATNTSSNFQKVLCTIRVETALSIGYFLTYQASISYTEQTRKIFEVISTKADRGLSENPDSLISGKNYLIKIYDGSATIDRMGE